MVAPPRPSGPLTGRPAGKGGSVPVRSRLPVHRFALKNARVRFHASLASAAS